MGFALDNFFVARQETTKLLESLQGALAAPGKSPQVYHAYGIGGIGKTALTQEIARVLSGVVVQVDVGADLRTATPLELMENIYKQLPPLADSWAEDFPSQLRQYQETRQRIESDEKGKTLIKAVQNLAQAFSPKPIGDVVKHGAQVVLDAPDASDELERFLAKFAGTKGQSEERKALRNLMLKPYEVLTKSFLRALRARVERSPVVVVLDTYEKVGPEVDGWLLTYVLRECQGDWRELPLRWVLMGRNQLSDRAEWSKLDRDAGGGVLFEVQIPPFTEQQTVVQRMRLENG
jgi:hypothetical protein